MQEESIIYLIVFLTGQTIALYKKLSSIEAKLNEITKSTEQHEQDIKRIKKVIIEKWGDKAQELIR